MTEKSRYIALTDINPGPEIDDIQSLHRLLLYSNEIDIEGLIACSSCFLKHSKTSRNASIIHRLIDAYGSALPNLKRHADGWPDAEALHSVVYTGIPIFGKAFGKGFCEDRWNGNEGVQALLSAFQKDDPRPLWIGLWGGANTLAQAVWQAERSLDGSSFDAVLKKLRIHAISDQDYAGIWLREMYGDRLFYIVSPSDGGMKGRFDYYKATWPGISADHFSHGSEDGVTRSNGFSGARYDCIDPEWIDQNIRSIGSYGNCYPRTKYITEGDTPSFLGLIPNGLNTPEHPEYGGWGGRYEQKQLEGECFPIWTSVSDTVKGVDGVPHTSPQATIWRWREAFQNDFAARMLWTVASDHASAPHPVIIRTETVERRVSPGDSVTLSAEIKDEDRRGYELQWYCYPEAGSVPSDKLPEIHSNAATASFTAPDYTGTLQVILEVTGKGKVPLTRYCRFLIHIEKGRADLS